MKYILTGEPAEIGKVLRENRVRVARGLIKFEPVPAEPAEDTNEPVTDTKDPVTDTKDIENPVDDTKEPAEDTKEPAEDTKEPAIDAKEPTEVDVKAPKKSKKSK